ncbi:hypothetical protein LC092_17175 [Stappia stellulata]|uniref:hypothetical protein n=1 Tax=Stappia stellulata TaxID=71235 RepID=UPI001CD6C36D|nr:hypothetical protein [Stappia stellulata]MCA1244180.1 hypothetical protein [Stappia stellulata]
MAGFSDRVLRLRRQAVAVVFLALGLAACVSENPAYPAYYRFAVDVKVDGKPVTIERVIKCTGEFVTGSTVAPSATFSRTYISPPVIGAKVPDSAAAVYVPVISACFWAALDDEGRTWEGKTVDDWEAAAPFTEAHRTLKPDSRLPILWVEDPERFANIEYHISERALSGRHGRIEFVRAHPPEKVDEAAFEASERRARLESPDLTPFFFPEDSKVIHGTKIYRDRFAKWQGRRGKPRIGTYCLAAWVIPREEWTRVPGVEQWVETLRKDENTAYRLSDDLNDAFREHIPTSRRGRGNGQSLFPIGYVSDRDREEVGRFAFFDTAHPVIHTPEGLYIDLQRSGLAGCNYEALHPERRHWVWAKANFLRDVTPNGVTVARLDGSQLWLAIRTLERFFIADIDAFVVFRAVSTGVSKSGEPVEQGWKE